eukprot:4604838-Pleurochrysis_carterae.AAC.1
MGHEQAFTAVYADGGIYRISPTTRSDVDSRNFSARPRLGSGHQSLGLKLQVWNLALVERNNSLIYLVELPGIGRFGERGRAGKRFFGKIGTLDHTTPN